MVMPVPMSVDADTSTVSPFDGDLDGDGDVDLSDVVIIGKYLNGQAEITDLQAADVNCNYLIDIVDQKIMLGYINGLVDSLPNVTTQPLHSGDAGNVLTLSAMDTYRNYTMCNYKSSGQNVVSSYTLTPNVSTYITPRAGYFDDRQQSGETAVVMVETPDGYYGSGFIVDNHIVATAAHCVYNRSSGFYSSVYVSVKSEDSTQIDARVKAKEIHIPHNYIGIVDSYEYCKYDYALIYVEEDLSEYGIIPLGVPSDEFMICNANVVVSGFPGEVREEGNTDYLRYNATGKIKSISEYEDSVLEDTGRTYVLKNHQIQYTTYVSPGQSGGPVYVKDHFNGVDYYTAIGINTTGLAPNFFGTRATKDLLCFYYNNSNVGSATS